MSTAKKINFKPKAPIRKPTPKVSASKVVAVKKEKAPKKIDTELEILICGKCNREKSICECGRPFFDGKDINSVLSKLEEVFSLDGTDAEACLQADISPAALYRYEVAHPEFRERKHALKEKLVLLSRSVVAKVIQETELRRDNTGAVTTTQTPTKRAEDRAVWYLERKKKLEFSALQLGMDMTPEAALTDERKAEIGAVLESWDMDDAEFTEYDDEPDITGEED